MRMLAFLLLVLFSGVVAGLVYGIFTLFLVEPYLDHAIEIENQQLFVSGAAENTLAFQLEFDQFRTWQKSGMLLGGVVLGISIAALFGIVYSLSVNSLPGRNGAARGLLLAGLMFAILYVPVFIKYPPTLPTEGDPETVVIRGLLFLALMATMGFGAVGFYRLYRRIPGRRILVLAGYLAFAVTVVSFFPANPDAPSTIPNVWEYRMMSAISATMFWVSLGIILGLLWDRYISAAQLHAKPR